MPDLPAYSRPPQERRKKKHKLTTTERGYGYDHQVQRDFWLAICPVCPCGNFAEHLHHRDGNPFNRSPENVECLCPRCHIDRHKAI